MIYRTFLEKRQVQDVSDAILSKKLKETCVDLCDTERICARNMVYQALNPEKYDGTSVIHRCVLDAAVRLLKKYGVYFNWEMELSEMYQVA